MALSDDPAFDPSIVANDHLSPVGELFDDFGHAGRPHPMKGVSLGCSRTSDSRAECGCG
jgi:hypothetical protein